MNLELFCRKKPIGTSQSIPRNSLEHKVPSAEAIWAIFLPFLPLAALLRTLVPCPGPVVSSYLSLQYVLVSTGNAAAGSMGTAPVNATLAGEEWCVRPVSVPSIFFWGEKRAFHEMPELQLWSDPSAGGPSALSDTQQLPTYSEIQVILMCYGN